MHRPVLGIVLILVIAGAPLAADICEATCAARDAAAPVSHHSCHEAGSSQQGASIAAVHICGHDDGAPTVLERIVLSITPPAVMSAMIAVELPTPAVGRVTTTFDSSPPTALNLIAQLRV
jgi:hypothetical protein